MTIPNENHPMHPTARYFLSKRFTDEMDYIRARTYILDHEVYNVNFAASTELADLLRAEEKRKEKPWTHYRNKP